MQHIDGIFQCGDIEYASLAQYVDPDLLDARPDSPHRLPVARLQSVLDRTQLKSCPATGLVGKIPEVVQAGPYES